MASRTYSVARVGSTSPRLLRAIPKLLTYLLLIGGSVLFVLPFLWMVRTSLMPVENIYLHPPQLIPNPARWQNYADMWATGPIINWVNNSLIVTALSMIGDTFVSALAAFGFARTRFAGRDKLFVFVLLTMMIPFHVLLIPRYILFRNLGWIDTLYPLIVPNLFGGAFSIFILRQFFMTLPVELDEAAKLDGASMLAILWRIILPLSKPALATVAVLSFISHWNDFIQPLVYLQSPEKLTLAVGIRWFTGRHGTEFHLLMAVSVVALLPILIVFFFAQKQFIQGIALTGVKG